jgi:hypothetical protein
MQSSEAPTQGEKEPAYADRGWKRRPCQLLGKEGDPLRQHRAKPQRCFGNLLAEEKELFPRDGTDYRLGALDQGGSSLARTVGEKGLPEKVSRAQKGQGALALRSLQEKPHPALQEDVEAFRLVPLPEDGFTPGKPSGRADGLHLLALLRGEALRETGFGYDEGPGPGRGTPAQEAKQGSGLPEGHSVKEFIPRNPPSP